MYRRMCCTMFLCCILGPASFAEVNWPCFRGTSCGVAADEVLPVSWSTTENVAWKVDILGRGWSCPVVWGDKICLTTVASEGHVEEAKKGLYLGGDRNKPPTAVHHWIVYCFDWDSGNTLWQKTVYRGKPAQPVHIKNTYASETPVTDGERVYFYFGNVGVFCFDFEGKELWRARLDPVKVRYDWGTAASPVLHGNRLFIVSDNDEKSYLLALDKRTGEEVFRVERDEKSNWVTPYIWQNAEGTEVVTCGTGKNRSYGLDGKLLWELGPMSFIAIPTLVEMNDLLYICSGFVGDRKNRPIYAIRPGASGDITPQEDQRERRLPPAIMVRSLVYRSLHRNKSIKTLLTDMAAANIQRKAPTDAAWCRARSKLPAALWPELIQRSAQRLVDLVGHQFLYGGRPVFLIDGSTVSMPDEPEWVKTFGYANTKHGLSRFPVARVTVLVRAGVQAVCDYKIGPYCTGEDAQFNQMWPKIPNGSICILDKKFCSFYNLAKLRQRHIHAISPLH